MRKLPFSYMAATLGITFLLCFCILEPRVALGTLYNYPDLDETPFGAGELGTNTSGDMGPEGSLYSLQSAYDDPYGLGALGFNLEPEDFGLLSWELSYAYYPDKGQDKIAPTRKLGQWAMKPSKDGAASAYFQLTKKRGGGGGGFAGGSGSGGGSVDLADFFNPPPQNNASLGNDGPYNSNDIPGKPPTAATVAQIPEPATFLFLGAGLLGIAGLAIRRKPGIPS